MIVQNIQFGSAVNMFLYWKGRWNTFPGTTAAGAPHVTHFTWCRGSEWVELLIYSTPCLYGEQRDHFLLAV